MSKYILVTKTISKYEDFERYHYKIFDNYFDLQKHLLKFWWIEKSSYNVFVETNITRDYSLNDIKEVY